MIRIRTVREFLWQVAEQYGIAEAYVWDQAGEIKSKTYNDLNEDVTMFARQMHMMFGEQRKIAVLGDTSYDWMCAFFGTIVSANIVVPMDMKSQKEDIIKRLNYADVSVVLLSDKYRAMEEDIMNACRKVNRVFSLESFSDSFSENTKKEVLSVVYPDQVSAMLFTSGTTGDGLKAAMLTQDGMLAGVKGYIPLYRPGDRLLSLLPIHHCFELFDGQMKALYMGCTICINDSISNLMKNMKKFGITAMVAVPAVANLFCSIIEREIKDHSVEEVYQMIGGHLKRICIGGAPTNAKMIELLEKVGVTVYDGYGLTESSGGCLFNWVPKNNPDSCGIVFAHNMEIKTEDGELMLHGPSVMCGYYKQAELTDSVVENGWLHTGDMAEISEDGHVTIVGRKDNMINLSNGEKVYPEQWEDRIGKIEGVTAVMVCAVADHLTAVIYAKDVSEIGQKEIVKQINAINADMQGFEKINDVRFRDKQFPVTSSMKIRRKAAMAELETTASDNYTPAQNNEQAAILSQVCRILNYKGRLGVTDNLYECGLDSLTTLELSVCLGCAPTVIYENKTVQKISEQISYSKGNMDEINRNLKVPDVNAMISAGVKHTPLPKDSTVLVTGATGYLGPHIVKDLLERGYRVFCLVRSVERLHAAFEYYGVDLDKVEAVTGDVTRKHFGLSDEQYIRLCRKVKAVFHVAATVNHVGDVSDSYNINVLGTKEVISFCKAAEAQLYHMSSFAVSGFQTDKVLTEDTLDIGQQITQNPYIQTKYQAEECVLQAKRDGLDCVIFRIGNLTKRASDGVFQINAESSGLSAQIRALQELKVYPESMSRMVYDDTPVDKAAEAIVELAENAEAGVIWHILNPNVCGIQEISGGKEVSDEEFEGLLRDNSNKDFSILSIYYRMSKDGFNLNFSTEKTVDELKSLGFEW